MNRRAFLAASTALTAGSVCGAATGTGNAVAAALQQEPFLPPRLVPPLVGSQLYGWGQYYDRAGQKLSEHIDDIFSALRDAGYDYAEGNLDVGASGNNAKLAERMKLRGLKPVSLYTGGALHVPGRAEETVGLITLAAKEAAQAGFGILNFNPDPIGRDKTDQELATQAKALNGLGDALKALGMKLGIHHHTPELRNGAKEFHSNFKLCPESTVGFCYDVHWVFRGGLQPADCLRQYGKRVVSWHLRQSRDQIWWEDLDTGDIDYAAVASHAAQNRLPQFYTVELALESGTKITRDVVENHARSRKFVQRSFSV